MVLVQDIISFLGTDISRGPYAQGCLRFFSLYLDLNHPVSHPLIRCNITKMVSVQ